MSGHTAVVDLANLISTHDRLSTIFETRLAANETDPSLRSLLSKLLSPLRASAELLRRRRTAPYVANSGDTSSEISSSSAIDFASSSCPSWDNDDETESNISEVDSLAAELDALEVNGGANKPLSTTWRLETNAAAIEDLSTLEHLIQTCSPAAAEAARAAVAATIAATGHEMINRRGQPSGLSRKATPIGSRRPSFTRTISHGPLPAQLAGLLDRHNLSDGATAESEVEFDLTGSQTLDDKGITGVLIECAPYLTKLILCRCAGISNIGVNALAALSSLTELDLSNTSCEDGGIAAIASGCRKLSLLKLHGCGRLTDGALDALGSSRPAALKELSVGSLRKITDAGVTALANGCPQLIVLAANGCAHVGKDAVALPRWASMLPHIECLDVSVTATTTATVREVAKHCNGLRRFTCSRCAIDDDALDALCACPLLEAVVASACRGVTDAGLHALAQNAPQLLELHLTGIPEVSEAGLVAIAHGCQKLEVVHLSNTCANDAAIAALARCCPNLHTVNAQGCGAIGSAALDALSNCPNIRSIDLRACSNLTEETVGALQKKHPECTLRVNSQVKSVW